MKSSSKFKLLFGLLMAVLFNSFIGGAAAYALGAPIMYGVGINNAIGIVAYQVRMNLAPGSSAASGFLFTGLNREIWLPIIKRQFRMDTRWLADLSDFNAYVNNDNINLAEAGIDPDVVDDYASSTGDIGWTTPTEDTPLVLPLSSMSTKKDFVDANLQDKRQYDIMSNRTERHIKTIMQRMALKGAYAIAPAATGATSPIITASGTIQADGFRAVKINDIIDLATAFRLGNMNGEEGVDEGTPVLVLTPTDLAAVQKEDALLFKQFSSQDPGAPMALFGFKVYSSTAVPRYNASTGAKVAFGAGVSATDTITSFAFLPGRAGKAEGTMNMFVRNNDPDIQGHVFNFMKRYWIGQVDGKGVGAIVRPNS